MKNYIYICLWVFLFGGFISSYAQDCGTEPSPEAIEYLTRTRSERQNFSIADSRSATIYQVPIKAHIVRRSDGSGGLGLDTLHLAIQYLNELYMPAKMQFFLFDFDYIDRDEFYEYHQSQEQALFLTGNKMAGAINIYFANSVTTNDGVRRCGYANFYEYFNPNRPILMKSSCALTSSLPHEIGHYFSLYHTHGKTNDGTTDELVNGSNCFWAGDDICDTPADPNLSGQVNSNCIYVGTMQDSNGDLYQPDLTNIMSYAPGKCRTKFTPKQYARMLYSLEHERVHLICAGSRSVYVYYDIDGDEIIRSNSIINANDHVQDHVRVAFLAKNRISLKPGFHAKDGARFRASISNIKFCSGWNRMAEEADLNSEGSVTPSNAETLSTEDGLNGTTLTTYPNPFSESTTISYSLRKDAIVSMSIRNALGQIVAWPIAKAQKYAGEYRIQFQANDLPNGLYFCTLKVGDQQFVKKMVLAR